MLQKLTHVKIIDKSGPKTAKVTHTYISARGFGRYGSHVTISIATFKSKVSKKLIRRRKRRFLYYGMQVIGMVIRTRRLGFYADGNCVRFHENSVILFDVKHKLLGKRFRGFGCRLIGYRKYIRLFRLSI
jgi:ribosomal protein L14